MIVKNIAFSICGCNEDASAINEVLQDNSIVSIPRKRGFLTYFYCLSKLSELKKVEKILDAISENSNRPFIITIGDQPK